MLARLGFSTSVAILLLCSCGDTVSDEAGTSISVRPFTRDCSTNSDCDTGFCGAFYGTWGYCTEDCSGLSPGERCPTLDGVCVVEAGYPAYCFPTCTSVDDCHTVHEDLDYCGPEDGSGGNAVCSF